MQRDEDAKKREGCALGGSAITILTYQEKAGQSALEGFEEHETEDLNPGYAFMSSLFLDGFEGMQGKSMTYSSAP